MNENKKKSMEGLGYAMKMSLAKAKNSYIRNVINGKYFFSRCNMIADQLIKKDIKENIDGCIKTEEFLMAEYALQKMQAITSMREAHFAKQELIKEFKLTESDIIAIEDDYYNGKIIRDTYDESYKRDGKAGFVDTSKD